MREKDCNRVEFCFNDFELEFSHVLWEVVVVSDMGVGESGGGFSSGVGALEGCLENASGNVCVNPLFSFNNVLWEHQTTHHDSKADNLLQRVLLRVA